MTRTEQDAAVERYERLKATLLGAEIATVEDATRAIGLDVKALSRACSFTDIDQTILPCEVYRASLLMLAACSELGQDVLDQFFNVAEAS